MKKENHFATQTLKMLAVIFGIPLVFTAQTFPDLVQQARLAPSDMITNQNFSNLLRISGNTAVALANSGAYVNVRSGNAWTEQTKLIPSDGIGVFADAGGSSVAIDGDTVVIGGRNATINSNVGQGAAYVFTRNGTTWTEQRLVASDGETNDHFAYRVSINGDTMAISAPNDDVNSNPDQGSVYIFVRSGGVWAEQMKISATDGTANALFGAQSVLDNGKLAVLSGTSVYIFSGSGANWTFQVKVTESDGSISNLQTKQFAFSGNVFVTGRPTFGGNNIGAAFAFTTNGQTWTKQTLLGDGDANSENFGACVAISGDTIAIGAMSLNVGTGAAYIFKNTTGSWTRRQRINAPNPPSFPTQAFGYGIAVDGNTLLVGSGRDLVTSPSTWIEAGYVYVSPKTKPFDFDGDGKTDISIFRPSLGQWWLDRSTAGVIAHTFGNSTDRIVPGDFTDDGKTDVAIWRDGGWYVLRSEDYSYFSFPFGTSGDVPVPADYDGDGKSDAAVFRPSNSTWYVRRSSDGGTTIEGFGAAGDLPVPADYDGDSKTDIAIYRPSLGQWWLKRSTAGTSAVTFGNASDRPVAGDYTGDGKADVAIWRSGEWYVLRSEDSSFYSFPFGSLGDTPVPGDYDGDGKTDAGVFRPSNATWYLNRSTAGLLIQGFGSSGDLPVPAAFVP